MMKNIKNNLLKVALLFTVSLLVMGTVGDVLRSVMSDANGVIQNTPLVSSNQISIVASPSSAHHIVTLKDTTNQTLNVSISNLTINAQNVASATRFTLTGSDGAAIFAAGAPTHSRISWVWYTNASATVAGWSLIQDWDATRSHDFSIYDNIASTNRLTFVSNVTMVVNVPSANFNSNVVVTGSATISGTNNSKYYQVNGIRGFTGSVTNLALANTNVMVYAEGILTNKFTIP